MLKEQKARLAKTVELENSGMDLAVCEWPLRMLKLKALKKLNDIDHGPLILQIALLFNLLFQIDALPLTTLRSLAPHLLHPPLSISLSWPSECASSRN